MAFKLQPDRPIGADVMRIVREEIKRAKDAATDAKMPLDERVHVARTSTKKIRAALRLVRPVCPDLWRRENARLREAARNLASLREAAVMPATLASLRKQFSKTLNPPEYNWVRRELLAHRRTTMSDVVNVRRLFGRFAKLVQAASRCLAKVQIPDEETTIISDGFGRTYRRARRAWHRAERAPSTEVFHEWRKCAKAHAYQHRLFRCAWPAVMRKWNQQLATLGDLLGEEHDLAVLDGYLFKQFGTDGSRGPTALLSKLTNARREKLRLEAAALGNRLFAEKSAAFAQRVSKWWRTAREGAR